MPDLKAYLDDSGGLADPNCSAFAIAGYVAAIDSWNAFEAAWKAMLDKNCVPYLHLKEFGKPNSVLGSLSNDARAILISDAVAVIGASNLYGVGAVVRINDVKRFNTENARNIDIRGLALYGCMHEIYAKYQGTGVEIKLDNFEKPRNVINAAMSYAQKYVGDDISQNLKIDPIHKDDSFKTIQALQAADFAVYEVRKYNEDDSAWFEEVKPDVSAEFWNDSHREWRNTLGKQWPGRRISFEKLLNASHIEGGIWDYAFLNGLDFYNLKDGVWSVPNS